jgi:cysteine desulfuration protein SufE
MSLDEVQEEIISEFNQLGDWMEKYNYLIELSKDLEPLDEKLKTSDNLINGCQSRVWLYAELSGDIIIFKADSDAIITKGIISLLIKVLSGRKPEEIMNADLYFIDQTGLRQNLSPTRSNGLLSMVKQMKMYGLAYQSKLSNLKS